MLKPIIFFSFLALASADTPPTVCPTIPALTVNLNSGQSKCYVSDYALRTWNDSRTFCQQLGGDLASIHSYAELNFLEYTYGNYFWIGLNVILNPPQLTWSDGSAYNYSNFYYNTYTCNSTVPYVYMDGYGMWYCSAPVDKVDFIVKYSPLCELPPVSVTSCPKGSTYSSVSKKCYQFFTSPLGWNDARQNCLISGGDLISIHSAADNNWVKNQAGNLGANLLWLGFTSNTSSFSWTDGSAVNYTNWNSGNPTQCQDGGHPTAYMYTSTSQWYSCWEPTHPLAYGCQYAPIITYPASGNAMAKENKERKPSRLTSLKEKIVVKSSVDVKS